MLYCTQGGVEESLISSETLAYIYQISEWIGEERLLHNSLLNRGSTIFKSCVQLTQLCESIISSGAVRKLTTRGLHYPSCN